jgi:hypothetical protein
MSSASITESGKVFGIGKAVCSWHQLWQGLDKFLKAASDDPDTVLHYEFMQDYKVLLGLFIFQTLMSGRGNERKLLKLKHEVFYAAQVNTI